MVEKKNNLVPIIIFSAVFLIIGGVAGYFIGSNHNSRNFNNFPDNFNNTKGNFQQLDQQTISEITLFFKNAQTTDEINSYCQQNPRYCMEYCRNINPENNICSTMSIGDYTRSGYGQQ
jgi:hypothetical protein